MTEGGFNAARVSCVIEIPDFIYNKVVFVVPCVLLTGLTGLDRLGACLTRSAFVFDVFSNFCNFSCKKTNLGAIDFDRSSTLLLSSDRVFFTFS